jgi:outer membrane protein assembly factor BamB
MKTKFFPLLILGIVISVQMASCQQNGNYTEQWPQFRGPYASGIVESTNLPDHWDMETGKNIKWKAQIPGLGHSSPIVWDNKIYLTTAVNILGEDSLKVGLYGDVSNYNDSVVKEFRVLCLDKNTGNILWNEVAHKSVPKTKRHTKASHADPTPATNGKYVVAFFGSNGLYCYTTEGHLVWKKDFEKMNAGYFYTPDMEWNVSSSIVLYNNTILIQCDILENSFLMALDVKTGDLKWKAERDEVSSYGAPTVFENNGKTQVIVNGFKHIGGYDFNTGEEIWKMKGGGDIPVPTPVVGNNLIYIHSAHGKSSPIYAIKSNAKGDISLQDKESSNEYIAWSIHRGGAYIPTGFVYGDYYYNLMGWNGKLSCFDAQTGKLLYKEKLPDTRGISASGIASNGKLYFATEQGEVFIIKAGENFEIVAQNKLNDVVMASPAISDNTLFFRTQHKIIAIGQ